MEPKFTVYKTVNLKNGKFYIGVHKTTNPNDSYLGSGKLILRAIAKYGEENFRKEILFTYSTEAEAFIKEFELVEVAKKDRLCYNLRQGGSGGFDWINRLGINNSHENGKRANAARVKQIKESEEERKKLRGSLVQARKSSKFKTHAAKLSGLWVKKWKGQHHTIETRIRLSEAHKGEKNSRFGMKWMTNLEHQVSRFVSVNEIQTKLETGWILGRKFLRA